MQRSPPFGGVMSGHTILRIGPRSSVRPRLHFNAVSSRTLRAKRVSGQKRIPGGKIPKVRSDYYKKTSALYHPLVPVARTEWSKWTRKWEGLGVEQNHPHHGSFLVEILTVSSAFSGSLWDSTEPPVSSTVAESCPVNFLSRSSD